MHRMPEDKRRRRSEVTEVALRYYLDTLGERYDLLAALLIDERGVPVARSRRAGDGPGPDGGTDPLDGLLPTAAELRRVASVSLAQARGVPGAARALVDDQLPVTELYTLPVTTPGREYVLALVSGREAPDALEPLPLPATAADDVRRILGSTRRARRGHA
jgi:hypothetical protein